MTGKNKILSMHYYDALRLLEDGKPHKVEFWKMGNGEIEVAKNVVCTSRGYRNRTHNIRFANGQMRTIRNICIRRVDDIDIYL